MKRIKVTHFLQDPSCCAVAACAVVANYYNPEIDYEYVKNIVVKNIAKDVRDEGLETAHICLLLNYLGFNKVTLVSSDLDIFDYGWDTYGKRKLKETIKYAIEKKKDKVDKKVLKNILKWYARKKCQNVIKIDYNFGKYIRKNLNKKKPVILSFNWSMFMKFPKEGKYGPDSINGGEELHLVAVNGYDKNGVWIVDSHHEYYKYKRKKYRKGFYKMSWENLFSCMGQGDLIIPDDYC